MDNTTISKYTISFGLSLALSSVINAALVVAKEGNHAVMVEMQQLTGHQWVTHSAIILFIFGFCGWLFTRANSGRGLEMTTNRLIGTIVTGVATSALIIVGFYLIAD